MSADGKRESNFTLFRFPSHKDKIPEDFFTDKETGLRPGENRPPSGVTKTFINRGFTEWTAFPPLEIWERGIWYEFLTEEQKEAIKTTVGADGWESWVVNGQGSPGNFMMRIYVVNDDAAAEVNPQHPLLWPEKHKRTTGYTNSPAYSSYASGGSGWAYTGTQQQLSPQKPQAPKTQAPALPAGIRFRCADCGHWFKEAGLAPHVSNCCPGKEESRYTDWAVLCECCLTLDEVSACKPGFPRPKKEVVPKEETEVKKDTASKTSEVVQ